MRWLEVALRAGIGYGKDRCAIFAAGVTYYSLISLFPLILFIVSIAAFFIADAGDQDRLIDELMANLPLNEDDGRGALEDTISGVVDNRGALGVVGFLATAYTAGALFTSVRVALNGVFHVEQQRPFVLGKAIDLGLVAGFGVLLLASFALTLGIAFLQQQADAVVGEGLATLVAWLANLAYLLIPPLVTGLVFMLLYTTVAHVGYTPRDVLPGVIVAALLFEALKVGFAWYIASFGNYDATYGTLGFVIILLLFFNFSAQVMLVGAEIARANAEVRVLEREGGGTPVLTTTVASVRAALDKARSTPVVGRFLPELRWLRLPEAAPADEAASDATGGAAAEGALTVDDVSSDRPVGEAARFVAAEPESATTAEPAAPARAITPRASRRTAAPREVEREAGDAGVGFGWWVALTAAAVAFVAWLSGQER